MTKPLLQLVIPISVLFLPLSSPPIHTGSGEDPYRVYNNLLMYMGIYIKLKKTLKWGGEESYHLVCVFSMVAAKFVNISCFVGDE
jgi:hypothetical protein